MDPTETEAVELGVEDDQPLEELVIYNQTITTFQEVWNEFYTWEPCHSCESIEGLKSKDPLPDDSEDFWVPLSTDDTTPFDFNAAFSLWDFEDGFHTTSMSTSLSMDDCPTSSCLDIGLKYESLAPSPCNASMFDPDDEKILKFIKYAGEEGFPEREHIFGKDSEFTRFMWQDPAAWYDPDVKMIGFETVKRLLCSIEDADQLFSVLQHQVILPQSLLLTQKDFFGFNKERDLLEWPGSTPDNPIVKDSQFSKDHIRDRAWSMGKDFCSYLSCVQHVCITHREQSEPWFDTFPEITNQELLQVKKKRCSKECYLGYINYEDLDFMESNQEIEDILKMAPDSSPCDLAVICKRPCFEMRESQRLFCQKRSIPLSIQLHMLIGQVILKSGNLVISLCKSQVDLSKSFVKDLNVKFRPSPCKHLGPCRQCECYNEGTKSTHCQRDCYCSQDYIKDVEAVKRIVMIIVNALSLKQNVIQKFANQNAQKGKQKIHECKNQSVQTDPRPELEVKEATFGMGLFATRKITQNHFIDAYVADILAIEDSSRHYAFNLNTTSQLDSITVGNLTRYANHAPPEEANIYAGTIVVNSDHIVVFRALRDIKKGEELLLDYGEGYWQIHNETD